MKNLIKEYLKESTFAKKSLKKEIKRIDKVVMQLAEIQTEQWYLLEEYKKDSYKEKYKQEHSKCLEQEKEISKLKKEIKNYEKGNS